MKKPNWDIIEYTKRNGRSPVEEFLDSLQAKEQVKMLRDLQLLQEYGLGLGMPRIRYLGNGLYELRTSSSNNIFRTTMFHFEGNQIVLLHSFQKKTQKTPAAEIARAKKYRDDFFAQKEEGLR